jgi:hypothetical protein
MKAIKFMIVLALVAVVSVAQAQKVFTPTTVVNGKPILLLAKEYDVKIFISTSTIYIPNMPESTFVSTLLSNFPKEANGIKDLCVPYFKYIYSLHKRGLTEAQVQNSVTGKELAELTTNLSSWNASNPGVVATIFKLKWRDILELFVAVAQAVIPFL